MKTYYYLNGIDKYGPFTIKELKSKGLNKDSLIWTDGMDSWKRISEVDEVANCILGKTPPPLPTSNTKIPPIPERPKPPQLPPNPNTEKRVGETDGLSGYSPMEKNVEQSQPPIKKQKKYGGIIVFLSIVVVLLVLGFLYSETDIFDGLINSNSTPNNDNSSFSFNSGESNRSNNSRSVICSEVLQATEIKTNSATLNGKQVRNDKNLYSMEFEFTGNGQTQKAPVVKEGDKLHAEVSNLYSNTTYKYCIIEHTDNGDIRSGYATFTTLPIPPQIKADVVHHNDRLSSFFSDGNLFGDKRKLIKACNYTNNIVRSKAVSIAGQSEGNFNLGQVCDIFDYCYNNWHYVNDPQKEIYEYASNTISNGLNGDCDDFAVLVCSMLLAVGGDARISFAYNSEGGHAFTEINVGKSNMNTMADYISRRYGSRYSGQIYYYNDKYGNHWLNMDWWAKHPGGQYYKADRGTRFYILDNYCEDF